MNVNDKRRDDNKDGIVILKKVHIYTEIYKYTLLMWSCTLKTTLDRFVE